MAEIPDAFVIDMMNALKSMELASDVSDVWNGADISDKIAVRRACPKLARALDAFVAEDRN